MSRKTRRCSRCHRAKHRALYTKAQWDKKKAPICKACWKKSDSYRAQLDLRYQREYGLSLLEYEEILERQKGGCYICRKKPRARRLAVDHDHSIEESVGKRASVRGLLCSRCNEFLGHIQDDPKAAERAAKYLQLPPWFQRKEDHVH